MHRVGRGPDGGLRGSVDVPERSAARLKLARQLTRQGLAPAQDLQLRISSPARRDQHAPSRRRGLHHRGPGPRHELREGHSVRRGFPADQHDAASGDEGQKQLEPGDVEGEGRDREQDVARLETWLVAHRGEQVGEGPMRDLHTLGPPGGPRSEDHVGKVFGPDAALERSVALVCSPRLVQDKPGCGERRQAVRHAPLRQHHHRPCLGKHRLQPSGRVGGIQGHVGPSCLQDGE